MRLAIICLKQESHVDNLPLWNEVGGFSVSYHIDRCRVLVSQWQGDAPEGRGLIVDDATFIASRRVHQLSTKNLIAPIRSIRYIFFSNSNEKSPSSGTWSQQVLTSETCGLTLFRIISRHSAASHCWWTAERVMKWFRSEILTVVRSCSLNHSPFLMASHCVMLRVSHLYIFILSKMCLSSLSTLLVVCCSLLSRSNFAEFYK